MAPLPLDQKEDRSISAQSSNITRQRSGHEPRIPRSRPNRRLDLWPKSGHLVERGDALNEPRQDLAVKLMQAICHSATLLLRKMISAKLPDQGAPLNDVLVVDCILAAQLVPSVLK